MEMSIRFTRLKAIPLTVFFLGMICLFCYLAHVVAFSDKTPLILKIIIVYCDIYILLTLLVLIDECAKMVRLNRRIGAANRRFAIELMRTPQADVGMLLKVISRKGWDK